MTSSPWLTTEEAADYGRTAANELEFVLRHYLPNSTKWWLGRLLAIGQAAGMELVLSDLDMPVTDNVASADKVLGALEKAGLIERPGWHGDDSSRRRAGDSYPRQWVWVPRDRDRIRQLVDRGSP